MGSFRLSLRLLAAALRARWQYRTNVILRLLAHLILTFTDFLGIYVLVVRFGPLKGWSLAELAVLYGMTQTAFAVSQMTARGFDVFDGLIRQGEFDRVLLRPRTTVLQLVTRDVPLHQLGRLFQGLVVLAWGLVICPLAPGGLALVLLSIAGGVCLYSGLAVLQATACFWTIEGLEVFNVLTYGGVTFTSYPLECYRRSLRAFFLYVVPLALVSYPPCLWVLGRSDAAGWPSVVCWCAPLAGPVFLALAAQAWTLGLRRYASTGS